MTSDELNQRIVKLQNKVDSLRQENWYLKCNLKKQTDVKMKLKLTVAAKRGSLNEIGYRFQEASAQGLLKEKVTLLDIVSTVSQNLNRKSTGKRYDTSTADFYEVLLSLGGPRLCTFVAMNIEGPHVNTVQEWRRQKISPMYRGLNEENIKVVAKIYEKIKVKKNIKTSIPFILAEDETVIEGRGEYDAKTDKIWGFCGPKSEDHKCEDFYTLVVGNNNNAYERLQHFYQTSVVGNYARVIMVVPLHREFPALVVYLQATCNRFTHNNVLHQWLRLEELCKRLLEPVLGPSLGHASDGDSRRRKLMLGQAGDTTTQRFKPISFDHGFLFSCRFEMTELGSKILRDLTDQDYIHNHKKLINPIDHPTRQLTLGKYLVHMNHLRLVKDSFPIEVHGLREEDVTRKDRQNWASCQRLTYLKVQDCLQKLIAGDGVRPNQTVLGTWAYIYIIWHYMEIFVSLHASLHERVVYAGLVTTFLGIWGNHIVIEDNLDMKLNFITRECFQDVILSCHYAVFLISHFRMNHSDIECPLDLTGTDKCETFFSVNGSWVMNKHTYSFLDMFTNLGHIQRLEEIKAEGILRFKKAHSKQDNIWDKQFEQDKRKMTANLMDYPSEDDIIKAWDKGVLMAKSLAREVGIDPDTGQGGKKCK